MKKGQKHYKSVFENEQELLKALIDIQLKNSGYQNSGYQNSGDHNSGYHNSGDHNSVWFNTDEPTMRFFNGVDLVL